MVGLERRGSPIYLDGPNPLWLSPWEPLLLSYRVSTPNRKILDTCPMLFRQSDMATYYGKRALGILREDVLVNIVCNRSVLL